MSSDASSVPGPADGLTRTERRKAEARARAAERAPPVPKVRPPPKPKPEPVPYTPSSDPGVDEQTDVHEVYERIAPHFSQTRHKPWPLISTFLHSLPPGSIGLDSGGGNGKYVSTAREAGVGLVVMDRSLGLLGIARTQPGFGDIKGKGKAIENSQDDANTSVGECVRGDLTCEGWRRGVFDFAISIAAIHHLSTPLRRRRAVQALLQPLVHSPKAPYACFMIYVWAYEQSSGSKRKMGAAAGPPPSSEARSDEAGEKVQDVLVPWVLSMPQPKTEEETGEDGAAPEVLHRYYHLFVEGELQELVIAAAEEEGYRILQLEVQGSSDQAENATGAEGKWLRVKGVGWEADNWWLEGEVGEGPIAQTADDL